MNIFTAFGLSSSAGLNAYLPLFMVALIARSTDLITLSQPWDVLENGWVIGALAVLLVIEIFVDKVPAIDTINDTIQTLVRPVAGAILFASSAGIIGETHPVLAVICGLILAGGVHAVKATARPVVTGTTGGLLNPVISLIEDVIAFIVSLLSILVPVLGLLVLILVVVWLIRRRRRQDVAWPAGW
ncbi:MAG: DUF4126 domain-containing protein [Anaerolineae bacterium]|nr:DUF4126 domain-containing protein [Anaerolineae bacterium]